MNLAHVDPIVLKAMGGVFAILVTATVAVQVLKRAKPGKDFTELAQRVKSWWVMASIFALAMLLSKNISIGFFAFISFLAFKEFLSIVPTRRSDRRVLFWAYLAIPLQYFWIAQGWYGMFIIFIPVYMFLLLPMRMVSIGETDGYLRAVGINHWGLMTTVFSLSHIAYLLVMPGEGNPKGSGPALVLYLVFLTQFNDVCQYIWGKSLGRSKIMPTVSPNKTWAGFLGGVGTTTVLAVVLAPWFTPFSRIESVAAGLLIGIGGFIGDVTVAALKRDMHLKDSGTMLPGHGGILDRVNSLTYTAPLFLHFTRYLHF